MDFWDFIKMIAFAVIFLFVVGLGTYGAKCLLTFERRNQEQIYQEDRAEVQYLKDKTPKGFKLSSLYYNRRIECFEAFYTPEGTTNSLVVIPAEKVQQ